MSKIYCLDYTVQTPGQCKQNGVCHINILYGKRVKTEVVNNFTNINKANITSRLKSLDTNKDHDKCLYGNQ